jgi:hypothetical protein
LGFTTVYRRSVTFFCVVVAVDVVHAFGETASPPAIQQDKLIEDVRYLSADGLGGRGNGSSGLEDAASYIEKRFRALGLEPAGEGGSFLQPFRVTIGQELSYRTKAILRTGTSARTLEPGTDFEPLSLSASGELEAPVVFAGYGVTAPDRQYDDYRSLDVNGRFVLLLRYAPAVFGEHGWHATFLRKAKNAASHGAAAVLIVNGPRHHRDDPLVPFEADSSGEEAAPIPVVHLRRDHAEWLMARSSRRLLEIQDEIDASLSPRSFLLEGVSVALTVDVRKTSTTVSNVLGFLPPTGPPSGVRRRSGEHIVVGAHYDHLGLGEKGTRDRMAKGLVHNGADDNASGVAGVLELARLFSLEAERPRGIVFAAFAGEELGVKGSSYYTYHPSLPTENAVAMINLDMIGRLRHDRVYIGGMDRLPNLQGWVEECLKEEGLTFSGRFSADQASDHAPFIRAGVPAFFFFTGLHGDYHKPTDDLQFINFEGMARVLQASYHVSSDLLHGRERPVLAAAEGGTAPIGKRASAYFGIGIDTSFEGDGLRCAYVAEDGPAALAGLEAGDILLEIDGRVVGSSDRASSLFRERQPGETVSAKVRRKDRILVVKVQLSRWP